MPPISFAASGKSFGIYVDASPDAAGFSNMEGDLASRIEFDDDFAKRDIVVKEMFAIFKAISSINFPAQLKIYSDS